MKKRNYFKSAVIFFSGFLLCPVFLTAQEELLPGKALGGHIFPPFNVSVGGGIGVEAGILGFETSDAEKAKGHKNFTGYAFDFPLFAFVDATYASFSTGPAFGFSDWGKNYRPGIEKPIGWDFSLFARFPIILNRSIEIYPIAGMRYRLGLHDSISYDEFGTKEIPKDYINSLWFLTGGGLDANLTRRIYLRTELLYSNRLGSGYGSVLKSEGYFSKIYEAGPELRIAVGIHLGKLRNLSEITADRNLATIKEAFSPSIADILAEFPPISFVPNTNKVQDPDEANKILEDVAKAFKKVVKTSPDCSIVIDGNANPVLHNEIEKDTLYKLSRERAFVIADILANRYGVPAGNISVFISSGINAGSNRNVNRSAEIKIVRSKIHGVYRLESGAFEPEVEPEVE